MDIQYEKHPWSDFVDWLESDSDIYWISGKPGAGESTLMRVIYEDRRTTTALQKWASTRDVFTPAFFLWNPGLQPLQKSIQGLLRSILYQILEKHPELTVAVVPNEKTNVPAWTERKLKEAFIRTLEKGTLSSSFCLFLDGLDELTVWRPPFFYNGDVEALFSLIVLASKIKCVKLCLSSREYIVFERTLSSYQRLKVHDLTAKDIEKYVKNRTKDCIKNQGRSDIDNREINKIVNSLAEKAEGVFLWVKLATESVRQGLLNQDSLSMLHERLAELPPEIDDMYNHLLSRIEPRYRLLVARYFRLLMLRTHPITVLTLALADLEEDHNFEAPSELSQADLMRLCKNTQTHVLVRCPGLLELGGLSEDDFPTRYMDLKNAGGEEITYMNGIASHEYLNLGGAFAGVTKLAVTTVSTQLKGVKSKYDVALYDSDKFVVSFPHRSLVDFLEKNERVLNRMENFGSATWVAPDALARALTRRLEILPWIEESLVRRFLPGIHWYRKDLLCVEQTCLRSFPDTVAYFDRTIRYVIGRLPASETESAGQYVFREGGGGLGIVDPVRDIHGLCSAWSLTHCIKDITKPTAVNLDNLLSCATKVFRIETQATYHTGDVIELLLELGANPNHHCQELVEKDNASIARITPWKVILTRFQAAIGQAAKETRFLRIMKSFLQHGASVESLALSPGLCVEVYIPGRNQRIKMNISTNISCIAGTIFCFRTDPPFGRPGSVSLENREIVGKQLVTNCENVLVGRFANPQYKIEELWFYPPYYEGYAIEGFLRNVDGLSFGEISRLIYFYDGKWRLDWTEGENGEPSSDVVKKFFQEIEMRRYRDGLDL